VSFAASLGLNAGRDSIGVAAAKIAEELWKRNLAALSVLELKPGDRVVKRTSVEHERETHLLEWEYVVSSVDTESLRVWFRGGNGQGAWPTQLEKIVAAV
jgi:hypothetical protein